MSRISYVNGRYLPHNQASVHIEDRGYQFGDGVYEVVLVLDKKLVDFALHYKRLRRSLDEISLVFDTTETTIKQILKILIRLYLINDVLIYIQVTRGVA